MKFTAQQIATQLEGTVEGDPNVEIFQLSKIEEAQKGIHSNGNANMIFMDLSLKLTRLIQKQ